MLKNEIDVNTPVKSTSRAVPKKGVPHQFQSDREIFFKTTS